MAYTKTVWQDQEGQVRYTETTDGDYKIFTPNYEEVTEIGTPVNALNMNHIENGIEYCDTNMVKRKSTSQATGSTTQPVYVKDDGTVESCTIDVSNTRFNGQWVDINPYIALSSTRYKGTYTIDVSSYLPNDSYIYELLLDNRISSDGNTTNTYLSSSVITGEVPIGLVKSSSDGSQNTFTFPVGADRILTYKIANNSSENSAHLFLWGYRRIGTNV